MKLDVRLHGVEDLRAAMAQLPTALTREARNILQAAANSAAVSIRTGYAPHRRTGNLQDSVIVEETAAKRGPFAVAFLVRVRAPHAHLFEYPTRYRYFVGTDRSGRHYDPGFRGRMWSRTPRVRVAVPVYVQARRRVREQLKAMLLRHGLLVTGNG